MIVSLVTKQNKREDMIFINLFSKNNVSAKYEMFNYINYKEYWYVYHF